MATPMKSLVPALTPSRVLSGGTSRKLPGVSSQLLHPSGHGVREIGLEDLGGVGARADSCQGSARLRDSSSSPVRGFELGRENDGAGLGPADVGAEHPERSAAIAATMIIPAADFALMDRSPSGDAGVFARKCAIVGRVCANVSSLDSCTTTPRAPSGRLERTPDAGEGRSSCWASLDP